MNNTILVFVSIFSFCFIADATAQSKKPNVLIILADDLGYHDLGCQGATDFKTPNIDKIARSGIRFTEGYISAPQCGPSRAGLLTGVNQARFGYLDNGENVGLPPKSVLQILPEQMKNQGYTTGLVGKWHIGSIYNKKTKITKKFEGYYPHKRGFDYVMQIFAGGSNYFPYSDKAIKGMRNLGWESRLQEKKENEKGLSYIENLPKDTYLTDVFSDKGVDFIHRNQAKPWFLLLSYTAPHTPLHAKPEKIKKYAHIKDGNRRIMSAMMDSFDEGVGKVLNSLEETGQLENTIIWFLSDNGAPPNNGSRNNPFSGLKGDVTEGGIRVPFIVSWKGVLKGEQVIDEPVSSLDILPTSLAVAGQSEVANIHDGHNLLPWLKGNEKCPNEQLFWNWRTKSAVRVGSLKEYRNQNDVKAVDGTLVPRHNFVDLKENPEELGGEKALQSKKKKAMLSDRLDKWLKQVKKDQKVLTPRLEN